jgi:hypothetical protein
LPPGGGRPGGHPAPGGGGGGGGGPAERRQEPQAEPALTKAVTAGQLTGPCVPEEVRMTRTLAGRLVVGGRQGYRVGRQEVG